MNIINSLLSESLHSMDENVTSEGEKKEPWAFSPSYGGIIRGGVLVTNRSQDKLRLCSAEIRPSSSLDMCLFSTQDSTLSSSYALGTAGAADLFNLTLA